MKKKLDFFMLALSTILITLIIILIGVIVKTPYDPSAGILGEGRVERVEYLSGGLLSNPRTIITLENGQTFKFNKIVELPSKNIIIYHGFIENYIKVKERGGIKCQKNLN